MASEERRGRVRLRKTKKTKARLSVHKIDFRARKWAIEELLSRQSRLKRTRDVDEDVGTSILGGDEAESLLSVEPLHGTCCSPSQTEIWAQMLVYLHREAQWPYGRARNPETR